MRRFRAHLFSIRHDIRCFASGCNRRLRKMNTGHAGATGDATVAWGREERMTEKPRKGSFMNVEIAQRLATMRREKGYSQEELAAQLGLSRQAISKWERAESSPDTGNLVALAKLYGVTVDELLRVEEDIEDDVRFEERDRDAVEAGATRGAQIQAQEAAVRANEAAVRAAQAAVAAAQARATAEQAQTESLEQATSSGRCRRPPAHLRHPVSPSNRSLSSRIVRSSPAPSTTRAAIESAGRGRPSPIRCCASSYSLRSASCAACGIQRGSCSSPFRCTTGSPTSSRTTRTIGPISANGRRGRT